MIGPIRCYTCGKVLGEMWDYYETEVNKLKKDKEDSILNVNLKTIKETPEAAVMKKLELERYCCKRMMLGHVNLIDKT